MVTTDVDKAADFLSRLKADRSFRDDFERDPFASLRAAGIEVPESVLSSEVRILGEGDNLSICFVAVDPRLMWPYRYYFLENRTDRELYLESWGHFVFGIQERRVAVKPNSTGFFGLATYEEIIRNTCNLNNNSHLVRDVHTDKVIAESFNCTCGGMVNYWIATGSGDNITATESHPAGRIVGIKVSNGRFVSVDQDNDNRIICNSETQGDWERFLMFTTAENVVTIMTGNGKFFGAESGGGGLVLANRGGAHDWEKFRVASLGDGKVSLRVDNGRYVQAENGGGGGLRATSTTVDKFEAFILT